MVRHVQAVRDPFEDLQGRHDPMALEDLADPALRDSYRGCQPVLAGSAVLLRQPEDRGDIPGTTLQTEENRELADDMPDTVTGSDRGRGSGAFGFETLPGIGEAIGAPTVARVYDALIGGKDHLAADREIAARVSAVQPLMVSGVHANRAFVRRAVRFLAEQGITQFIDCGCGLPTGQNVHEVARRVNSVRTVYVDVDPIVLAYGRALLVDNPRTIVVEGDVREPEAILEHPDVRAHVDFTRPVAAIMAAVLHFSEQDPAGIVRVFTDAMAPGSTLVVSHVVVDGDDAVSTATRRGAEIYSETTAPVVPRSREQVRSWFAGFQLVEPGLVDADKWRRSGTGKTTAPIVAGVGILDSRRDRSAVDGDRPGPPAKSAHRAARLRVTPAP